MSNQPVQIVLNADNFVASRENQPGGGNKEFFPGADQQFVAHQASIRQQLEAVRRVLAESKTDSVGYAKVSLQRSAYAKSHHPTAALFTPRRSRVVGNVGIGNLLVELTPDAVTEIETEIARAEPVVRTERNKKSNKLEYRPTRRRSEVGAVREIGLWSAADKRSFSAGDAVRWLSDPRTGGSYRVELFDLPQTEAMWDLLSPLKRTQYRTFVDGLKNLGTGITAEALPPENTGRYLVMIRLAKSNKPPLVRMALSPASAKVPGPVDVFQTNVDQHERLLRFLDSSSLVRTVELSPILVQSSGTHAVGDPAAGMFAVPQRIGNSHPIVGVVDGGVSTMLGDWVRSRWNLLAAEDRDEVHGSFIGGLLVAGRTANPHGACPEGDGCDIVDIDIFPRPESWDHYYRGSGTELFFDELEAAIADLRARHGVRVFNLSINVMRAVDLDQYSVEASRLDVIADRHDVIIVISAGNTDAADTRAEWVADAAQSLAVLARARNDALLVPAETLRNISVAALNPPGHASSIPHAPAGYSRRGPGLRAGVKPDLAHVGGSAASDPEIDSGLFSCSPDGRRGPSRGTSFAAPQVAKALALLDSRIEGHVSRETLMALLFHRARIPTALADASLAEIARDLVGFGMPATVSEMLEGDDHEITLVFASRLHETKELRFQFPWPPSLVGENGSCRGTARLTLVATPPVNPAFGAELVRVNVEAVLQQEHGESFKSRLKAAYLPHAVETGSLEADLIQHSLKWSHAKVFQGRWPRGIGKSSNWRLAISYLTRDGEVLPPSGVPFTAILTIADLERVKPVFNEVRQSLQAAGVRVNDIRTAARVMPRV